MGSGYESFRPVERPLIVTVNFGVLDQIGNIWEWVATDAEASVFAWTSAQSEQGLATQVVNEGVYVTGNNALLAT